MYIEGVTAVTNDISLTAAAPPSGVKAAIEAAILRNAQLNPRAITLEVADADVTLRGTARSWAERRQAEQVAWAAPGVTSVKNDLAVTS
jgi:osmotically-inducible protein OsmY